MTNDYEFSFIISTTLNITINHNHNLALDHMNSANIQSANYDVWTFLFIKNIPANFLLTDEWRMVKIAPVEEACRYESDLAHKAIQFLGIHAGRHF